MIKKLLLLGIFSFLAIPIMAQDYFPKNDGVKASKNTNYTVFKNVTLHPSPGETIKNATLVIQNGKIVSAGKSATTPANSVVVDLAGKHIYPSFVELYSGFGIEAPSREGFRRSAQYGPSRDGYYWNDHIRPETNALEDFKFSSRDADSYIKAGFGVVNAHKQDAIARGTSVLVTLNEEGDNGNRLLDTEASEFFSFERSNLSSQSYPSSVMGMTALVRQLYVDADWYAGGNVDTKDLSLEALNKNKSLPQFFIADGLYADLRVSNLAKETGTNWIIVGGGDEYKRVGEIKATGAKFVLPLDFPDAYDVEDPYQASFVSLSEMKHWNQAPTNPAKLAEAGVTFALTSHDLKSPDKLLDAVKTAIKYGLDEKTAMAALTTIPAGFLNKSEEIGSIKTGAWANFLITSGEMFDEETVIYENWVQGSKNVLNDYAITDIDGSYTVNLDGSDVSIKISGSTEKPRVTVEGDSKRGAKISYADGWANITFTGPATDKKEFIRLIAQADEDGKLVGKAIKADGSEVAFNATKTASAEKEDSDDEDKEDATEAPEVLPLSYPNVAFGFSQKPEEETVLFKNATVWTSDEAGVLENTDVLVKKGKIAKIGKDLSAGGAKVVDATGKYLTAGIIDEHSHIAAFSINEGGHNSSAEVRMSDVVDPDDVAIYRDLAGGVTTIQLLHGSANPIGGQSAVMKLKWGSSIDDMVIDDAKFIKFALGENVKQSNWDGNRFPQTRMGVEQVFVDYFQRAKEYGALKASGQPYRKDYELETLLEILNGERFITSHSYVQSEINMLMKVAESFDFRINTFTHILEGYKVADKMKEHGVGGSTFSDWWAYKYEVNDAIPYNAAIMHSQGITVAINSDDAEMSRRLNQEAAKTIKYGGVEPQEAWKFVTINPAKLLHIDDRTGSIKEGKDADLVLWSANPLSVTAVAEKTMIEGVTYFDIERDQELREELEKEKNKLTTMMLAAKNKGLKTQPAKKKEDQQMTCDTMETIH